MKKETQLAKTIFKKFQNSLLKQMPIYLEKKKAREVTGNLRNVEKKTK